ncbi:hypothetical protein [Rubrobacter aplysinae]|uniref:hypothetical protein n=1 Tax=Rubrobacter aplysinae TaxID=909625 RepID=UPI00064C2C74|nr:hypothetical protein [Rubrobacter aplysinae]
MSSDELESSGNGSDRNVSAMLATMRDKIPEAADRPLFEEAVICFEAGALRASYIVTWISVAESLRNRFSAMAHRGDGQAGKVLKELERLEKDNQATDLHLLDQAKALGLVTNEQHDKLSHLRDMRNRYAHPTGRGPTEQETLAALEIAVDGVLSQPTLLRHGYADYQLAALFDETHWLPDDEQAVRENAAGVARRLHPIAAPRLLEGLVEGYEQVFGDPERDTIRRRAGWFLGGFVAEMLPNFSEPRWSILEVVRRRPVAASLMLGTPEAFGLLPDQARGMVLGHLTKPVDGASSTAKLLGLRRARGLLTAGLLTPEELDQVRSRVDEASYRALQSAGVPLEAYADRLLDDLRSHNWDRQNAAASALGNAGPYQLRTLRSEEQEQMGRNVLQAAQGSSFGAQGLIDRIRRSPASWPGSFVSGLFFETLVDDGGLFRLKGAHLPDALAVLLARGQAVETLGRTAEIVQASEPKRDPEEYSFEKGWFNQYDEAVEILTRAGKDAAPEEEGLVGVLIEAVRCAKPPEEPEE